MGTTSAPAPTVEGHSNFMGWLEAMRAEADMSWAEVSRRSGISENGLRKIRQGETTPRPATLEALAQAFGVPSDGDDVPGMSSASSPAALAAMAAMPVMPPIGARRGHGTPTTYLTVGVSSPRAAHLDSDTAGRLMLFLEHSARIWLATADCPEGDE